MTDKELQEEILAELACETEVHPERIGVSVENGVVTLSGHADSYGQKLAVERVVKRVYSAQAIVDHLEVRLPARDEVPDPELAQSAVLAIEKLSQVPADAIRITVRDGHVTLEGAVDWHRQRQAVENAVHHLRGVRGVHNHLTLAAEGAGAAGPESEASLRRALTDGDELSVKIVGREVTLSGSVTDLRKGEEAAWAASRSAGYFDADNSLDVVL